MTQDIGIDKRTAYIYRFTNKVIAEDEVRSYTTNTRYKISTIASLLLHDDTLVTCSADSKLIYQ